jgi:AraC-like DNA-binding protein
MKRNTDIISLELNTYRRLLRARVFIDNHYTQSICLSKISENAFFSTFHFIRVFKKAFYITPHQYIIKRRIEKAKHLLSNFDLTITDICYMIGFESLGSFSILFKKSTGYSPFYYRLMIIARKRAADGAPEILIPGCFVYMHITGKQKSNFQ